MFLETPIHKKLRKDYPELPEDRGTGRSTTLAFYYIWQALSNPYKEITIEDHFMGGRERIQGSHKLTSNHADWHLADRMAQIVHTLGLEFITFKRKGLSSFPTIAYGDANVKSRTN